MQVAASEWPNEMQVERKSKTCVDLQLHNGVIIWLQAHGKYYYQIKSPTYNIFACVQIV